MSGYFGVGMGYVKKEDATRVLKYQRLYPTIITIGLMCVWGAIEIWVMPRLMQFYRELDWEMPFYTTTNFRWGLMGIIALLLIKIPRNSEQELVTKLKKYKSGEMILMTDLMDMRREWIALALVSVMVAYLIISVVLPIYKITAQL